MTREKAIQMTKARIKVLKASKKTGKQEAAKALELLLELSQERPKGRWIKETQHLTWEDVDVGTCSVCGVSWFLGEDEDCLFEEISEMWDFCPACGADMRESE